MQFFGGRQHFDDQIAKPFVCQIFDCMLQTGGRELAASVHVVMLACLAVPWGAYNLRATSDVHEIRQCVTMAKGVLVRADFDCVDADPFVFDHQVMVRLVSYGDHVLARVILSFVHDCSKAIVARAMPTTYGQFVNLEVMGRTAGAAGIVTLSVIQESAQPHNRSMAGHRTRRSTVRREWGCVPSSRAVV